jgi:hypothetical protein
MMHVDELFPIDHSVLSTPHQLGAFLCQKTEFSVNENSFNFSEVLISVMSIFL